MTPLNEKIGKIASGVGTVAGVKEAAEKDGTQIDCLLYSMGARAEDIFKSFTFEGNDEAIRTMNSKNI